MRQKDPLPLRTMAIDNNACVSDLKFLLWNVFF